MKRNILKANSIGYRQGFIEVIGNIHPNSINIETWNINPDRNIEELSLDDEEIKDEDVCGNTEIELNIDQVKELIRMLEKEIENLH